MIVNRASSEGLKRMVLGHPEFISGSSVKNSNRGCEILNQVQNDKLDSFEALFLLKVLMRFNYCMPAAL